MNNPEKQQRRRETLTSLFTEIVTEHDEKTLWREVWDNLPEAERAKFATEIAKGLQTYLTDVLANNYDMRRRVEEMLRPAAAMAAGDWIAANVEKINARIALLLETQIDEITRSPIHAAVALTEERILLLGLDAINARIATVRERARR